MANVLDEYGTLVRWKQQSTEPTIVTARSVQCAYRDKQTAATIHATKAYITVVITVRLHALLQQLDNTMTW